MMQWDLAESSLGDLPKELGSSLEMRREIVGKKTRGLAVRLPEVAGVCGMGSRQKFARRFAEGIGKLTGNAKGDHQEEDQRTYRKIARGCWSMRELRS
ncbi:hypothetical protein BHE74_00029427 [Ensete ventricosum]|nr:hypothetical protein BHE74_00029427 [Ensete ventricosum]